MEILKKLLRFCRQKILQLFLAEMSTWKLPEMITSHSLTPKKISSLKIFHADQRKKYLKS